MTFVGNIYGKIGNIALH